MNTRTKIGLIECAGVTGNESVYSDSLRDYLVKKVFSPGHFSADMLIKKYPEAEIVNDRQSIFQDNDIDLVIVSSPCHNQLEVAGEALQAGKHVRIL